MIAALFAFCGLILGSFIATLTHRVGTGRSIISPPSSCEGCHKTLSLIELIPVLSYFLQRGQCRFCGAGIGSRYLWIEFAAAVAGFVPGFALPPAEAAIGAAFGWILLTMAIFDFEYLFLPDIGAAILAAVGISAALSGLAPDLVSRLIGGTAGYLALRLIAIAYRASRKQAGLGGGDPKLLGAIGLNLGWQQLPAVVLLAAVAGLVLALIYYLLGKPIDRTTRLPFGSCLAGASWIIWIFTLLSI